MSVTFKVRELPRNRVTSYRKGRDGREPRPRTFIAKYVAQKLLGQPAFTFEQPIEITALQAHIQLLASVVADLLAQHRPHSIELGTQSRLGMLEHNLRVHHLITHPLGDCLLQQLQPKPLLR